MRVTSNKSHLTTSQAQRRDVLDRTETSGSGALLPRPSMTETPDVCRNRRSLVRGELCASHRRHRAAILLGLLDAVSDHVEQFGVTAIGPQPFPARQIGTHGRALTVRAVASRTSCSAHLTVEDAVA